MSSINDSLVVGVTNPLVRLENLLPRATKRSGLSCLRSWSRACFHGERRKGSLAINARIGPWGSLETPFFEIYGRSTGVQMLYLSPSRDAYYTVASALC